MFEELHVDNSSLVLETIIKAQGKGGTDLITNNKLGKLFATNVIARRFLLSLCK